MRRSVECVHLFTFQHQSGLCHCVWPRSCIVSSRQVEPEAVRQVEELCYITDNTYTRQDMLGMEKQLLNALGFQCTVPTARVFARRFVQAAATKFGDPRHVPAPAVLLPACSAEQCKTSALHSTAQQLAGSMALAVTQHD